MMSGGMNTGDVGVTSCPSQTEEGSGRCHRYSAFNCLDFRVSPKTREVVWRVHHSTPYIPLRQGPLTYTRRPTEDQHWILLSSSTPRCRTGYLTILIHVNVLILTI
jgi:hypothetical protein